MKAPDFTLLDAQGKKISLKDFRGKKVVLYFYPRDNTPGCTIEAMDFTKLKGEFAKKNAMVIGISKDSCESHQRFIDKKSLDVILLSDEDHSVQERYDVWKPKKFMGKEFMGTVRSTFLIDEKGEIIKEWRKVSVMNHAKTVLESL